MKYPLVTGVIYHIFSVRYLQHRHLHIELSEDGETFPFHMRVSEGGDGKICCAEIFGLVRGLEIVGVWGAAVNQIILMNLKRLLYRVNIHKCLRIIHRFMSVCRFFFFQYYSQQSDIQTVFIIILTISHYGITAAKSTENTFSSACVALWLKMFYCVINLLLGQDTCFSNFNLNAAHLVINITDFLSFLNLL